MALSYGKIGPFQRDAEQWSHYAERLAFFSAANKVTEAPREKAILLSVCGPQTYQLIRTLLAPRSLAEEPLPMTTSSSASAATEAIHDCSEVPIQQSFQRRRRESVATFIAALRKIADYCDYQDTLKDMLRDRLVCGVNHERIQRALLAETDLTFDIAFAKARAMEAAESNAKEIRPTPAVGGATASEERATTVHRVQQQPRAQRAKPQTTQQKCYRCNSSHLPTMCRFKDLTYRSCHKRGHIARACRSTSKEQQTHCLEDEDLAEDVAELSLQTIHHVGPRQKDKPFVTYVTIGKKTVSMEIDTGASVSVLSEKTYKQLWSRKQAPGMRHAKLMLRTYTGESLKLLGEVDVTVRHEWQVATLPILIGGGEGPNLLGRDWLRKLKLDWRSICNLKAEATKEDVLQLIQKYPEVFDDKLGTLVGVTATLHVNSQAKPKFYKARPIPYSLRGKVDAELERLQREGVLEPVVPPL